MLPKPDSCRSCVGWSWGPTGYVPAEGTGANGCLMILEAAGEDEAKAGRTTVGKAGQYLWGNLSRIGIEREGWRIHNALSCQPPNNKLAKQPYELSVIQSCSPLLDATITDMRERCRVNGKTFTILALGRIAFARILGIPSSSKFLDEEYYCYSFWSERYGAWVLSAPHPSYLMRGNSAELPILQFAAQRALEIASNGFAYEQPTYILDPEPATFLGWVRAYKAAAKDNPDDTFLSFDIETPYKKGKREDQLDVDGDDGSVILRCSFAYRENEGITIPWAPHYMPALMELFAADTTKIGWNCPTPDQRILTSDLRWVRAGDLKVGDELAAIDEEVPAGRKIRRYTSAKVTRASRQIEDVFKVSFSDGSSVKVTAEHPWLIVQTHRTKGLRKSGGSAWVKTCDLKIGCKIRRLIEPWETDESWEAGYLAGFFDGEGHITPECNVGAAQHVGATLENALELLHKKGFRYTSKQPSRAKDSHIVSFYVAGGVNNKARFLGQIRPQRLLRKFKPEFMGSMSGSKTPILTITGIEPLGEQEIVQLSTTSHTYIVEGFAAHNCDLFDVPRIQQHMPINGAVLDAMVAWHILHAGMPKGLGFVTPFYAPYFSMWKHLSDSQPALYAATDAVAALRCWKGIQRDLRANDQWHVYGRHVLHLNKALRYMSNKGLMRDDVRRQEAEDKLVVLLGDVETEMTAAVPKEALSVQIYKKTPKSTDGLVAITTSDVVRRCSLCGLVAPTKPHFKAYKTKENPCAGGIVVGSSEEVARWARYHPFKVSLQSMTRYQKVRRHQSILDRDKKVTFDGNALKRLRVKYPTDPLYPIIGKQRHLTKMLSVYIGRTVYEQVEVSDDYQLKDGEKWANA